MLPAFNVLFVGVIIVIVFFPSFFKWLFFGVFLLPVCLSTVASEQDTNSLIVPMSIHREDSCLFS